MAPLGKYFSLIVALTCACMVSAQDSKKTPTKVTYNKATVNFDPEYCGPSSTTSLRSVDGVNRLNRHTDLIKYFGKDVEGQLTVKVANERGEFVNAFNPIRGAYCQAAQSATTLVAGYTKILGIPDETPDIGNACPCPVGQFDLKDFVIESKDILPETPLGNQQVTLEFFLPNSQKPIFTYFLDITVE